MILAIDFSRTLEDSDNVPWGKKLGPPIKGAKEALEALSGAGHTIIIHSVLPATPISKWLDFFQIPYDSITRLKPRADWYIDDKGLHFDNWKSVMIKLNEPQTASKLGPGLDSPQ